MVVKRLARGLESAAHVTSVVLLAVGVAALTLPAPDAPSTPPTTVTVDQLQAREAAEVAALIESSGCAVIDAPSLNRWPTSAVVAWDTGGLPDVWVEHVPNDAALADAMADGAVWVRAWCA